MVSHPPFVFTPSASLQSHRALPAVFSATRQLEFRYLSRELGDDKYAHKVS